MVWHMDRMKHERLPKRAKEKKPEDLKTRKTTANDNGKLSDERPT